jgi:hypothetical protein
MKRISPLLVLLALTPGVSEAYGYGSRFCGVRYTPYAFSYRNSGLVSGFVNYTPYAFTYRSSGLVPGYGVCYGSSLSYGFPVGGHFKRVPRAAFRAPRSVRRFAQDVSQPVRPPDGVDIIRQHLLAKGIAAVDIDRIFRIDNQLVSVDVIVKDRNLLIKYWNPQEIEALDTKEGFKQKIYEKYRQDWTQVAARHEQNGGQVYDVEGSDTQTIVAALDSCTLLDAGPETSDRMVLYARD